MKYIGIICATDEELSAIYNIMDKEEDRKYILGLSFVKGVIEKQHVIVVKCGVGKVNAARCCQILIDNFDIQFVINIGVARGLSFKLNIGDIVIGKKVVQHDFDITAFKHSQGYIPEIGNEIKSDEFLVKEFQKAIKALNDESYKIVLGTIATGDQFVTDVIQKDEINLVFKADACEMEGGAIAQICYLANIPFVIIRSISDVPNGENQIEYSKFLDLACKRAANILKEFCKEKSRDKSEWEEFKS